MSYPLNNVTTADAYTLANTLDNLPICARLNVDCANQAIYVQIRAPDADSGVPNLRPNTWNWQPEIRFNPGFKSLDRRFSGFKVRSAVAGQPANVTLEALSEAELGITGQLEALGRAISGHYG